MIAIDPGASGGIADMDYQGRVVVHAMPETEGDLIGLLCDIKCCHNSNAQELVAVLEEVGGFAGGPGQPGSAMFKFGRSYGFVLGALQMAGWRIHLVRPQKWLKALGMGTRGELSKTEWKNKLKAEAQRRFPHLKVTLKTADALLLLEASKSMVL